MDHEMLKEVLEGYMAEHAIMKTPLNRITGKHCDCNLCEGARILLGGIPIDNIIEGSE